MRLQHTPGADLTACVEAVRSFKRFTGRISRQWEERDAKNQQSGLQKENAKRTFHGPLGINSHPPWSKADECIPLTDCRSRQSTDESADCRRATVRNPGCRLSLRSPMVRVASQLATLRSPTHSGSRSSPDQAPSG